MKNLLAVGSLLAVLPIAAVAQNQAFLPDNVPCTSSAQALPFGWPSVLTDSLRYQMIIPASVLPNQPLRITEVGFIRVRQGGGAFSVMQFNACMSHTTVGATPSSIFANNISPCPTELVSATSGYSYDPPVQTWSDLSTTCDFGYDGKRDLCLEIRYRGKSTSLFGASVCFANSFPRVVAAAAAVDNYAATTGNTFAAGGVKVRITYTTDNTLLAPDTVRVGSPASISLRGLPAGSPYALAASFGQTPQKLGGYSVCLDTDALFNFSLSGLSPIFRGYLSRADSSGDATATLNVPNIPQLAGTCVYHAAIALAPGGGATNTAGTMITP